MKTAYPVRLSLKAIGALPLTPVFNGAVENLFH